MNEPFHQKLGELMRGIEALPPEQRARLLRLKRETVARHEQMKQDLARLQGILANVRIGVKYVLFDLEATRRENQQLRHRLGEE